MTITSLLPVGAMDYVAIDATSSQVKAFTNLSKTIGIKKAYDTVSVLKSNFNVSNLCEAMDAVENLEKILNKTLEYNTDTALKNLLHNGVLKVKIELSEVFNSIKDEYFGIKIVESNAETIKTIDAKLKAFGLSVPKREKITPRKTQE